MRRPGKMPAFGLVSRFQDGLFVLVADQDAARASTLSDTLHALGLESKRVTSGDEVLVIRLLSALLVLLYVGDIVAPRFDRQNWPGRSWLAFRSGWMRPSHLCRS